MKKDLLNTLGLEKGKLVLLYFSYKRMKYLNIPSEIFLETNMDTVGQDGTNSLTAYGWDETLKGYPAKTIYFEGKGSITN